MPDRFSFRALPIATGRPVASVAASENPARDESNELEALINGDFSTVAQVHPRLRFQAIGSCPVPLRASVMRVVLFKLLGTGVFAALVAAGSSDPIVVKTCGLAAAINAVAVVHYMFSAPAPAAQRRAHAANARSLAVGSMEDSSAGPQRQAAHGPDGGARARQVGRLRRAGLQEQLQAVRAGDRGRFAEA